MLLRMIFFLSQKSFPKIKKKIIDISKDIFLGVVFCVHNLLVIIWHIGRVQINYQILSIKFINSKKKYFFS